MAWAGSRGETGNWKPPGWATTRQRIFRRDSYRCTQCAATEHLECDHINSHHDHTDTNLRTLCAVCHRKRTLTQAATARQTARAKAKHPVERHPGLL